MTARGGTPVYMLTTEDGGILLDLANNRFLKLNPIGVQIWTALSEGASSADVGVKIAAKYHVELHRVVSDITQLLLQAAEIGLSPGHFHIAEPESKSDKQNGTSFPWYGPQLGTTASPRNRQVLTAIVGLFIFDFILSTRSLQALCESVQGWPVKQQPDNPQLPTVGQVCAAVEKASLWYPKKSLCLQRSAVATWLLRREGIAAELVLAVRAMPFMAHAWVEVNGDVINDRPHVKRLYRVLARY